MMDFGASSLREDRVLSPSATEPEVSALAGDARIARLRLEHYAAAPVSGVHSVEPGPGRNPGKPAGFWVSVAGENDWPSWCRAEAFGLARLRVRHAVTLAPAARVLLIDNVDDLDDFDERYGEDVRLSANYTKHGINWQHVGERFDGIIIAPYQWCRRLDTRVSDWYYGWDCASGCIWNADAILSIAPVGRNPEGENARSAVESRSDEHAVPEQSGGRRP